MSSKNKIILFFILIFLIVGALAVKDRKSPDPQTNLPEKTVILRGEKLTLWLAETPTNRSRGLSGVTNLPENGGMIFVFENPARHGFWMKDMLIPIDILWFDAEKRLIYIMENVSPDTYPEIFRPSVDALYVIELPTGKSHELNLKLGDSFQN